MKVFVTGGTGFAGHALTLRLIELGHDVSVLDTRPGFELDTLKAAGANVRIGSVTDREAVRDMIEGAEVVYHLAAAFREMNVPDQHYYHVNVDGTRLMLEESERIGVRKFVYCSTCGVHGDIENPPAGENAPIAAADYYQQSKYEAEPVVEEFHQRGMNTVILRPAAIYGPGDPDRFGMIFRQVKKGFFPMFGDGSTLYHPLYVDNLTQAFINVMPEEVGNGGTYLIADAEYLSIRRLVDLVSEVTNMPVRIVTLPFKPMRVISQVVEAVCKPLRISPPIFPRRVDWYRQNRAFDISRARAEIAYAPAVDIREGLTKTAEWYFSKGML